MKAFWILGILASGLFAVGGIVLGVCDIFLIEDGTFLLIGLLLGAIGAFGVYISCKSLREEKEAEKKLRQTHGDAYADAKIKQANQYWKKVGIISLAIIVLLAIPIALSVGNDPGSAHKDECKVCGRENRNVMGFDYCAECLVDIMFFEGD